MDRAFPHRWPSAIEQLPAADQEFIGLSDIIGFLGRYVGTIAVSLAAALLIALFYVSTTDSTYTASTQILIEPRVSQHLQDAGEVNLSLDTAQMESQIAVMQSEKIATMVIDQLKLLDDPDFNRPQKLPLLQRVRRFGATFVEALGLRDKMWFAWLRRHLGFVLQAAPANPSEYEKSRLAMLTFRGGLDVRRVGVSYAIDISFTSLNAEAAARIANATADAFVREQLETKADAAKQGGAWLETRLEQLRDQMNKAMAKAQEFRSRHDYSVGDEAGAKGGGSGVPTLEELETTAETYQKMYESFLQAYTNSVSQQSYPVADARVITEATAPLSPSAPKPKLVLAFAAVAGLAFGIGLSFVRHMFDRTVGSARQIRENLGVECVGELPRIGRRRETGRIDEVLRKPHAPYTGSLRKARTEISLAETDHPIRFLGMTAASDGGSKSSVVGNLAALYSMSGLKTLVIDADVQHTITARLLGPSGTHGGPCQDPAWLNITSCPGRSFDLLPGPVIDARKLLMPKNMEAFLSELTACDLPSCAYDIVILDMPTLASGADLLKIGSILDGVVMVAECGETHLDTLRDLTRTLQTSRSPILGVLLTRARAATFLQRRT
ncbi:MULTISPECIES: GumC family protein [Phyllobacteriaceae]|uniref:ATPase n=1 Tax=Ollibium composti TaxID=2675109 RepID=A0ABY2Q5Z8_9HYPH|nr:MULTISPECIES: GNVR domain-containing protein [Mesorhizobium]QDC01635.1 ATPase [Mesorhizobium sp. 8]THF56955.1 ATPase [Mesorhizobium composti]